MVENSDIIVSDKEARTFEAWGAVNVVDKSGELVSVDRVAELMPIYMERGGILVDSHSSRHVGRVLKWEKRRNEKANADGIYLWGLVYKHLKIDNAIWNMICEGLYKGISIGGQDFGKEMRCDQSRCFNHIKDLEFWEFSLVESPMNKEAWIVKHNEMAKSDHLKTTITIEAIDEEGKIKKLIEHIKRLGNGGHSFGVIIDPDIKENMVKWGWDGDGSDKIIDIREENKLEKSLFSATELKKWGVREKLANLEHEQWMAWSKDIAKNEKISEERVERWKEFWVPYEELGENDKDEDRKWAEKVLDVLGGKIEKGVVLPDAQKYGKVAQPMSTPGYVAPMAQVGTPLSESDRRKELLSKIMEKYRKVRL